MALEQIQQVQIRSLEQLGSVDGTELCLGCNELAPDDDFETFGGTPHSLDSKERL